MFVPFWMAKNMYSAQYCMVPTDITTTKVGKRRHAGSPKDVSAGHARCGSPINDLEPPYRVPHAVIIMLGYSVPSGKKNENKLGAVGNIHI